MVETKVPSKHCSCTFYKGKKERKAKSILLLATPDEYQLRFHTIKDAKSLWAAIKSRFGGNDEEANLPGKCKAPRLNGTGIQMPGIGAGPHQRTVPVETSDAFGCSGPCFGLSDTELVVHQKNEVVYEEKIAVLEFEVKDKSNAITRLINQLEQTLKEKEDLKAKLEQFETSSKNLTKLINSQISSKDKTGLGYGDQLNENGSSVPLPLTGNYIPSLADLCFVGLDDSVYRPTTNKTSAKWELSLKIRFSDDDEDIFQSEDSQTHSTKFKKIEFTKARNETVKSDKQAVKPRMVTQSTKRMPKESILRKGIGHKEVRPIWNNTQRINHQNKFVPTAVLTRSGRIPVSTAKQSPFYKPTVLNTRVSKEKVNTVRVNGVNTAGQTAVSTVKGNGVTAVKASASYVWRPKKTDLNNGSNDNSGSWISKRGNPQQALKYKGMFESGCSRHMTGNKALLIDYQDIDRGKRGRDTKIPQSGGRPINVDGIHAITATIDGRDKIITEASIKRHLKLQYLEGLSSLPNAEIFEQLTRMGTYSTPTLTNKLFNNMRRASKGYSRVVTTLFDTMLVQPQGEAPSTSLSRITSSPSLSSHHTPPSTPNTSPSFQTTHEAEETTTMPHDSPFPEGHTFGSDDRLKHDKLMELVTKLSDRVVDVEEDLKQTKKTYSTALTKLVLKVKKLEKQVRSGKARRRARIILSEDEDAAEDFSKQGRKIAHIDIDPTISLVQDEGTSWFQEDLETQEKNSADTEVLLEEETPTKLIEDLGSGKKGQKEISTADVPISTAGTEVSTATHDVSTAAAALPPKKLKKMVQVQMSVDEELARKVQEEEQAKAMAEQEQERINFEAALELQRQLNERKEVLAEATQSQTID
ncbi:hypothetical protein Tco_0134663 [Tanacetum coccineum]